MVSILASGSELEIAQGIRTLLQEANIPTRIVSMPCWELFERLEKKEQDSILGVKTLRVAIEAAVRNGWDRWIGGNGMFFGLTGFGASAPYKNLYDYFGLSAKEITSTIRKRLES